MKARIVDSPSSSAPLLAEIRDFIDSDAEPLQPVNPIQLALRAVRGREWQLALASAVAGLLLALLVFISVNPAYQSSAVIRVLPREATILYVNSDDSRLRLYDAFVIAEMNLLRSRPTLDDALLAIRAAAEPDVIAPADVGQLGAMLDVRNNKGLVSVFARSGNPDLAFAAINAVIDAYEAGHRRRHERQFEVRETELANRQRVMKAQLASLDREYLEIGGEHDMGTLAKAHLAKTTQLQVIEERIDELATTIAQMEVSGGSGTDVGDVEIQRATLLDNALAGMTNERARRLAQLETLRSRYQPRHPLLRDAEVEVRALERAITERLEQIAMLGRSGALTGGGGQDSLADLRNLSIRLALRRDEVRAVAAELNGKLIRIGSVNKERLRLRDLLDETERALDKIIVESNNDLAGTVDILSRGAFPERPIEDKRRPLAAGAMLVGAGGTAVMLVLWTLFAGRLRFSDDLDGIVDTKRLATVLAHAPEPNASLAAAAFALRNSIDLLGSTGSRVIAIAGSEVGVGTTAIAAALARALAEAGRPVLRIDVAGQRVAGADLGLLDVAARQIDLVDAIAPGSDGLPELVLGGLGSGMESRNLTLAGLRSVLEAAASHYDSIIMDAGVLRTGAASALVAAVASSVVLVTAAGASRAGVGVAAAELLRHAEHNHLIVFNRAVTRDPGLRFHVTSPQRGQE